MMSYIGKKQCVMAASALMLGMTASSHAVLIVNDTSPNASDYFFTGGSAPTLTGGTELTAAFNTNAGDLSTNNLSAINRVFPTVNLAEGDAIELKFTATLTNASATPTQANGFRFGLYSNNSAAQVTTQQASAAAFNNAYSGIGASIFVSPTDGTNRMAAMGNFVGTGLANEALLNNNDGGPFTQLGPTSGGSTPTLIYGTPQEFTLLITRNSATGIVVAVTGNEGTRSFGYGTFATDVFDDFNTLSIGLNNTALTSGAPVLTIDNLTVTYTPIPEPGSFALAGLAGLAMLRRRRA